MRMIGSNPLKNVVLSCQNPFCNKRCQFFFIIKKDMFLDVEIYQQMCCHASFRSCLLSCKANIHMYNFQFVKVEHSMFHFQVPTVPVKQNIYRERAGHFLLIAKFTFKLSFCATHPLNKRPFHSFAYLCPLQNPGGWVGLFLKTLPWSSNHPTKVIVSSW